MLGQILKEDPMVDNWLAEGETIIGEWSTYMGDPKPNAPKITGKLIVTNQNVHFRADLSLTENAATKISQFALRTGPRETPFFKSDKHLAIPYPELGEASIVKKGFLLKALQLKLKTGEALEFQFGAASPKAALEAITARK
jgi:hypothetical protein